MNSSKVDSDMDYSNIPYPLLMGPFLEWAVRSNYTGPRDIENLAEELELESIPFEQDRGVVEADLYRPYIISLGGGSETMYMAVHTLTTAYTPQLLMPKEQVSAFDYEGNNQYYNAFQNLRVNQFDRKGYIAINELTTNHLASRYPRFDSDVQDFNRSLWEDPITHEQFVKEGNKGSMGYLTINGAQRMAQINTMTNYVLHPVGGVCWGQLDISGIYYLDELMNFGTKHIDRYINWLSNPLTKSIKLYKENRAIELERMATNKRKDTLAKSMVEHYADHTKSLRKSHRNKMSVIGGNCPDGVYFNYEVLDYIGVRLERDIVTSTKNLPHQYLDIFNLHNLINQMVVNKLQLACNMNPTLTANHHFLMELMEDIFGDSWFIVTDSMKNRIKGQAQGINEPKSWCHTNVGTLGRNWFKMLYDSGIDLSDYLVSNGIQLGVGAQMSKFRNDDSIGFRFTQEGFSRLDGGKIKLMVGALDKSKHYKDIKSKIWIDAQSKDLQFVLPKWWFVKYEGGKVVEL